MTTIDVAGVVLEVAEKKTVRMRAGKYNALDINKVRRYVTLIDDSNCSITLTLWDKLCDRSIHVRKGDVLVVKGVRVSGFGGKSLNAAEDHAVLFINLNHEKCRALKLWYSNLI